MTYEPELGQMFLGSKYTETETPEYITDGINRIDELINTHIYEVKRKFSYGEWSIDYSFMATSNTGMVHELPGAPFTMRAYYWGDCDCGFDDIVLDASDEADKRLGYTEEVWDAAYTAGYSITREMHDNVDDIISELLKVARLQNHTKDCTPELPNFSFPGADFEAFWYKHSVRGATCKNPPSEVKWQTIEAECTAWILAQSPKSPY